MFRAGGANALAAVAVAAVLLLSNAAAAPGTCAAGDSLLFAFFESEELYYALSQDGLHWDTLNANKPVMTCAISDTSLRDPYLHLGSDGVYHLVATNGRGFGANPDILTWQTADLISYSNETVVPVMSTAFFPTAKIGDTWAPEWVNDDDVDAPAPFFVFWAARGQGLPIPSAPACNNSDTGRFAFFGVWTSDFINVTQPQVIFDPGCNISAPVGDGGIDGDIVKDEAGRWTMVYKDARGSGESVRGIRLAYSSTGRVEGPYLDSTISELLVPTLVEAPEIVTFVSANGTKSLLLYYDCSFMPTPAGYPRPPYGVATSPSLSNPKFTVVEGACTGTGTSVSFPKGATHGSFVCVNATQAASLRAAFPN